MLLSVVVRKNLIQIYCNAIKGARLLGLNNLLLGEKAGDVVKDLKDLFWNYF